MKRSYNDLFLKILSILEYRDKENFVKNFERMNHLEAMANCIEKLPEHARREILAKPKDPQIMQDHINKDEYKQEITSVSEKALSDFLQHLTPALSDNQKEKIADVFASFEQ